MTRDEVLSLQPHDEVYWSDPDEGLCSGFYKILEIDHRGPHDDEDDPVVRITTMDGGILECYASELGWGDVDQTPADYEPVYMESLPGYVIDDDAIGELGEF